MFSVCCAFSTGCSPAPWLTSSQSGGHLTPTSYSSNFLLKNLSNSKSKWKSKSKSESESKLCYERRSVGQSASLSRNRAPIWGLWPDFYYCQTVAGVLMWSALSIERTDLSFTIAAGPRHCSNFRVRVPWDSWSYFSASDSRLPFS
jgi:hypothetical protein